MSVEVKTPTRTQFEHPEFPCGERSGLSGLSGPSTRARPSVSDSTTAIVRPDGENAVVMECNVGNSGEMLPRALAKRAYFRQDSQNSRNNSNNRRRSFGERSGGGRPNPFKRKFVKYGRSGEKMVLPSKFLLGGNIHDPLNLNNLDSTEKGRALNESTPQSSPLPFPSYKQQVHVLIPPNINDPLNLNTGEELEGSLISPKAAGSGKKKKHKHKKRKVGTEDTLLLQDNETEQTDTKIECQEDFAKPVHVDVPADKDSVSRDITSLREGLQLDLGNKMQRVIDKIVSPVLPQISPKQRKRKRTSSEGRPELMREHSKESDSEKAPKAIEKSSPHRSRRRHHTSQSQSEQPIKFHLKNNRFGHGNYSRYYGYRNPNAEEDHRIKCFRKEWFEGKELLDVGCNVGHLTLILARDFGARKVVGMDIDGKLISAARKNIRYYLSPGNTETSNFPVSLPLTYGPITGPSVVAKGKTPSFPNNIMFVQGNYILEKDELLDLQKEEYDVLLVLSLTKWLHLNNGDDGLKRAFKRMYRQLRPGGKLILEPQAWSSYKHKKKLTEAIFKEFQQIRFKPDQFTEYLLSREVGFATCEMLDVPYNKSKGFQRPIFVFTKAENSTANTTPRRAGDSRGVTPLMDIECTPNTTPSKDNPRSTPKFQIGSTYSSCQNTPTYLYSTWSATGTPQTENVPGSSREDTPADEQLTQSDSPQVTSAQCLPVSSGDTLETTSEESVPNFGSDTPQTPAALGSESVSSAITSVDRDGEKTASSPKGDADSDSVVSSDSSSNFVPLRKSYSFPF